MIKFRLLLVAVAMFAAGLMANVYYWSTIYVPGQFGAISAFFTIVAIPAPFMFLAALAMLLFSFLKVEEQDGMLVYDQKNLYWRIMSRFYDWDGPISLCRAFWTTVFTVFVVSIASLIVFGVMVVIKEGRSSEALWSVVKVIGGFGGFIMAWVGLILFINWLDKLKKSENKLVRYIARAVLVLLFLIIATGLIIAMVKQDILLMILIMIAIAWGILGILKIIESLPDNNALIQMFRALRENLCPILAPKQNS